VAHLIRDCQDAAETYPEAHWPIQIRQALQGLVHAANLARAQNLKAIPAEIADPLIDAYRHGVRIGLKDVARVPGRKQPKHRALLEGSPPTCGSHPPRTRPNATCGRRRPSRRSLDSSPARRSPNTGTPSAATSPP